MYHFIDEFSKCDLWAPAKFRLRFGRITQQRFNFGRTEVPWINCNDAFASIVIAFSSSPSPFQVVAIPNSLAAAFTKSYYAVLDARCDDEVFGLFTTTDINHCISM
jgi:hypothetical protein